MEFVHGMPHKLGRYEVAGHLASGGMAEVLLGRVSGPSGFERVVVLKRILPHLARQESLVNMFLDEARIIARIRHSNVVNVHELSKVDGELFMVMEYLEGESVSSLLRRLLSKNESLGPRLAAFIVAEACAGLHAAHELRDDDGRPLNVVHRDVSPQNVFITYSGAVKVIDFGIAVAADRIARTETGELKGKLDYMSPEQCRARPLDRRTDVFAMGVVLYELLAQRRLFKRPSPGATIHAVLHDPIVPPSRVQAGVPTSLDAICARALERDPKKRYQTALDMRRELAIAMGALGGDRLPEEELAALMRRVLDDRRQIKEEMLARIREGSIPTELPSPEAESNVEIPAMGEPKEHSEARTRRGAARWPIAVAVVGVGAAAVFVRARSHGAQLPPPPPAPQSSALAQAAAGAPPEDPTPGAAAASSVHVVVESEPPGATILIDGSTMGVTPTTLTFARGSARRTLVLRKGGFVDDLEDFSSDVDQKLRFSLKAVRPTALHTTSPPRKASDDQPPPKW